MGRRGPRHGGGGGSGGFRPGGGGPLQRPAIVTITQEEHEPVRGPPPGFICVASQYTLEQQLRQMQRETGCDPSREDSYRLQGVQLIDSVREALQLPVKTFATACTYYHKFRLHFRDAEYNFQDAALSALFVACKVEDTIKKSKDVLCAAYNIKNPDKPTTPDDKIFDRPSTIIVGLDRLILQTVGFDFRVRHPQKLLVKLIRQWIPAADARAFLAVAYPMAIDLYKTFAPVKQTSFAMALAIIELTARVLGDHHLDRVRRLTAAGNGSNSDCHTSRGCVIETLLDLLDLYTQFTKSTKVGPRFDLGRFIEIKIQINLEVDDDPGLDRFADWCDKCAADDRDARGASLATPGSATSPATTGSLPGSHGAGMSAGGGRPSQKRLEDTMRFVFDADKVRREQATVAEYFKEEYEEEDVLVDEPQPEQAEQARSGSGPHHLQHNGGHQHNGHNSRGHGPIRRERSHNHAAGGGNGDAGWGPYQRNRNNDRHKTRKRGRYY